MEYLPAAEMAVAEHRVLVLFEAMQAERMVLQATWNAARDTGSLGS